MTPSPARTWLPRMANWFWGLLLLALFLVLQSWNAPSILTPDGIHFLDADCYSRMTRVKMLQADPLHLRIAHHEFENYPLGTQPHTTAPMDLAILALATVLGRDMAGALISPLLGVLTILTLWIAAVRMRLPYRHALTLVFTVSPIVAHGFAFGRPDHQSLILLLVTLGLLAEIGRVRSPRWNLVWGLSWGLALWTSLFEPLVLLAAVLLTRAALYFQRRKMEPRTPSRCAWIALTATFALGLLIDGVRLPQIDAVHAELLKHWSTTIGELRHATWPLLFSWIGWSLPVILALLGLAAIRRIPFAGRFLFLVILMVSLCLIHARWGYFLALIFCLSLPFALGGIRQRWIAYPLLLVSLWPVAAAWDAQFFPDERAAIARAENRSDFTDLHVIAAKLAEQETNGGILAPWWLSPALAYWSGWPLVGGSSHQSIDGTADTARFYLGADPLTAREILAKRHVRYVVSYDADRLDLNSSQVLNRRPAGPTTARHLARPNQDFLPELKPVLRRGSFILYEVTDLPEK